MVAMEAPGDSAWMTGGGTDVLSGVADASSTWLEHDDRNATAAMGRKLRRVRRVFMILMIFGRGAIDS
jgi:hypothetical protein